MRYDKRIHFYQTGTNEYDPHTHSYGTDKLVGSDVGNVTDYGLNNQARVLGELTQGAYIVRTKFKPMTNWDYVKFDNSDAKYRFKQVMQTLKGYAALVIEDIGQ